MNYKQTTLRETTTGAQTVSWIDSTACNIGTTMTLVGKSGVWEVISASKQTITTNELQDLKYLAHSFRDRKTRNTNQVFNNSFWG